MEENRLKLPFWILPSCTNSGMSATLWNCPDQTSIFFLHALGATILFSSPWQRRICWTDLDPTFDNSPLPTSATRHRLTFLLIAACTLLRWATWSATSRSCKNDGDRSPNINKNKVSVHLSSDNVQSQFSTDSAQSQLFPFQKRPGYIKRNHVHNNANCTSL